MNFNVTRSIFVFLVFIGTLVPLQVGAQTILNQKSTEISSSDEALKQLLESAKIEGSRIIVIEPGGKEEKAKPKEMTMGSVFTGRSLIDARNRLSVMIPHTIEIYKSLPAILAGLHPDLNLWWILRAVVTAIAGVILGQLTFNAITGWARKNIREQIFRDKEKRLSGKLGFVLFRATFMTVSIAIGFAIAILVALIFDSGHEPSRKIIFSIISTYSVYRILRSVVFWNIFMPDTPSHRLVNLTDEKASSLFKDWGRVLAVSSAIILFCSIIERLEISEDVFRITFIVGMLISGLLLAVLTILHREDTRMMILGAKVGKHRNPIRKALGVLATPLMLGYIIVAWVVTSLRLVLGAPGGFVLMAAPIIVFVTAIFIYGLAQYILEKVYQFREVRFYKNRRSASISAHNDWRHNNEIQRMAAGLDSDRDDDLKEGEEVTIHMEEKPKWRHVKYFPAFKPFFNGVIQATIITVSLGELARLWGFDVGRDGGHPIASALDIILVMVIAIGGYRALNSYIDFKILEEGGSLNNEIENPADSDSEGGKGQSRLATLLPIFRNVLVSFLVIISLMIILANLGIDVGPLFAGAGVVGIAIGFGAQTLIRDIFSGAFFLLDDAFRKGEYIEIDDVRGVVEKISMRSFQLRHHLGSVYTIPFGEIKQIKNYSRDWVMMKLPLRVTYDTDVEVVRKLIKKLGQELLKDPAVGELFLQPLKSQGVYAMEDSAMIIRVKFMTRPGDQFVTRKAVYAAIRDLFNKEGIKFAHREVTVRLADEKKPRLTAAKKRAIAGAASKAIEEPSTSLKKASANEAL